jgi:hypothetical protein
MYAYWALSTTTPPGTAALPPLTGLDARVLAEEAPPA